MGMSMFSSCRGGYSKAAPAPNPDPKRWAILQKFEFPHAYVLIVKYHDCTNFEGVKVMVYLGKWKDGNSRLDPHFSPDIDSPVARFKPDAQGIEWAKDFAARLEGGDTPK